jgi:hypothetical protein
MSAAAAGEQSGPTAPVSDATPRSLVDVIDHGDTVVIAVGFTLDESAGAALLHAAAVAANGGPRRIDVDLRALESFTNAGARALVGCRDLGARLPEGLHYRTGRGAGRDALLAAYTDTASARGM